MSASTEYRRIPLRGRGVTAAAVLALGLQAGSAAAARESQPIAGGLTEPVFVTAPQGDPRLFIVEKGGQIKIRSGGSVLDTPFLSIAVRNEGESGLLGLAFDPQFDDPSSESGYRTFYVNYIHPTSGDTVVASYRASASNPNLADLSTAKTILTVPQPEQTNHKAGWMGFRPGEPNNLYIATGDGGASGDRAQDLNDNLGKILRVNVREDAFPEADRNYAIPAGNPFAGAVAGNDEIWAYGLRNPYRNSFDRQTGAFYIADVGQSTREEVDFEPAAFAGGANYGWPALEGTTVHSPLDDTRPPMLDYGRDAGGTVIGGYVVHGGQLADLEGMYVFGDYVSGRIWAVHTAGTFIDIAQATDVTDLFNAQGEIGDYDLVSFGEDGFGRLYLVTYGGTIYAMVPEASTWMLLLAGLLPAAWAARRARPRAAG